MSDDTPQLQVQVDVAANAAPAQQVADALGGVKQAAGEASTAADKHTDAMDKMGQGAVGAGHVLRGLEMAGQGSARGLFSAAQGARHLMDSFGMGAMGPLALFIGGISAGVMTLIKLFQDSKKEAEKLNEESAKLAVETQKLINLRLQSRVDEYAQMAKNLDAATTAQERFNATRIKMMDARIAADLAKVDLEEAEALFKLKPNDTVGRARTSQKYAEKRSDIQNEGEIAKASQEVKDSEQKATSSKAAVDLVEQKAEKLLKAYEANKHEDADRKGIVRNLDVLNEEINAAKAKPLEARSMGDMEKIALGSERRKALENMLATKRPQKEIDTDLADKEKQMADLETEYNAKMDVRRNAEWEIGASKLKAEGTHSKFASDMIRGADASVNIDYEEHQRAKIAKLERQKEAEEKALQIDKERERAIRAHEDPREVATLRAIAKQQTTYEHAKNNQYPKEQVETLHAEVKASSNELSKSHDRLLQEVIANEKAHTATLDRLTESIKAEREARNNTITN